MQQIMQQIKKKKYPDSLHGYTGNLLMVAINYDKKSKKHQCIIEKIIQWQHVPWNVFHGFLFQHLRVAGCCSLTHQLHGVILFAWKEVSA